MATHDPSDFKLVWHIPTHQCRSHRVFTGLAEKYGFVQNKNDEFKGDKITILYDTGAFPTVVTSDQTKNAEYINGGLPQEGDLTFHLEVYKEKVKESIPDEDFSGLGVIDFEGWRPIYRQNWGACLPIKDLSIEIERKRHPLWPEELLKKEAIQRFETSAAKFMLETLRISKELRPKAKWGYYGYPHCFNMRPDNTYCSTEVQKENDRTEWLFSESDTLHPSLYMSEVNSTSEQRVRMVHGRITESIRIKSSLPSNLLIYPYFWCQYRDTKNFLTEEDLRKSFAELKAQGADGVILWGSSNDVNTKEKCEALYHYIDTILGPIWTDTIKKQ